MQSVVFKWDPTEEIYMRQPPGYVQSGKEHPSMSWSSPHTAGIRSSVIIEKSAGFKESGADTCVFIQSEQSNFAALLTFCYSYTYFQ